MDTTNDDNDTNDDNGVPMITIDKHYEEQPMKHSPIEINYLGICACIFFIASLVFLGCWLAESKYSNGILRYRYLHEPCTSNSSCAPGLYCNVISICANIPYPCSHFSYNESDDYDYTMITSASCPVCPICPTCPSPTVHKVLSYFDYNEFPNHWIDPGPQGFYDHIYNVQYGACKELCARDVSCYGICYDGFASICWELGRHLPKPQFPVYNGTYSCAIKTFI